MRTNIETLNNRHSRYMEINVLMNSLLKEMRKSHNKDVTVTLTSQNCIDIANAIGDMATMTMREIREKAEGLKQKSILDIERAKSDIEFANHILGE